MSEETESSEQPTSVELSFGIVGASSGLGVNVRFSDGVHLVQPHVIAELGGPNELEKLADGLASVTYDQFMQEFHSVVHSRRLNQFQADFVANHFAPKFF